MKNLYKVGFIALALAPAVAFAQNATQVFALLNIAQKIIGYMLPLALGLGVVYIIWNIIGFVTKTNEEERAAAKMGIVYGVVGLAAAVSIWGLVAALQQFTGVGAGQLNQNQIPCVIDNDPQTPGCQ